MDIMSFGLRDWANREPDRVLVRFPGGPGWTYGQVEALANRFAHLYRQAGLRTGEHVAGIFANDPYTLAAVWGAYRAGIYFTPVANTFSTTEVAYVAVNSEAKIVIADARYAASVGEFPCRLGSAVRFFVHGGEMEGYEALGAMFRTLPDTPLDNEMPRAMMLYSSGTTGAPKGIFRPLRSAGEIGEGPPPSSETYPDLRHRRRHALSFARAALPRLTHECAVVGVPDPDFGERPVAFIVRDNLTEPTPDEGFTVRLEAFARMRLGKTKQLKSFYLVDELPRTPTGKLQQRSLCIRLAR